MPNSSKIKTKKTGKAKLRNTFLFWFLIISVIPLGIVSFVSFNIAHKTFRDNAVNSLINAAKIKKDFLESYFTERITDLDFQSQDFENVEVLKSLKKSFTESGLSIKNYTNSYEHAKLIVSRGENLRKFQISYGYIDVLLMDSVGNLLFSITRHSRQYLGTNMFTGKYANTNFVKACKQSMITGKPYLSDFEFCKSITNEIDCFIVQVIVDKEGHKIGLIALQIPIYSINKMMWDSTGLGNTGETYLVGDDLLMRSDSRFIKNSTVLNVKVNTEGVKKWLINKNKFNNNPIYQNPETNTSVNMNQIIIKSKPYEAFNANIYTDYRGIKVLGVSTNIAVLERLGVSWILLVEIDEHEAFHSVSILRNISVTMIILTIILVFIFSLKISKRIVNPIDKLANLLPQIANGNLDIDFKIESKNEIGLLERSFRKMAIDLKRTTVSKDYLENIFESMYDILVVLTPGFKVETANKQFCKLLDYPLDYVTDKLFNDFFLDNNFFTESELKKLNQNGSIYDLEKIFVSKKHVNIPILISVSKMNNREGTCQGIVCVAKDITEQKHYEEERENFVKNLKSNQIEIERTNKDLKKAFEALKESQAVILQQEKLASIGLLAAGIAHEINNPIGFVSSNINTLGKYVKKITEFITLQDVAIKQIKQKEVVEYINENRNKLKLNFIFNDMGSLIKESLEGTERIRKIVLDLKNFTRHGDEESETADINECIKSSLNIVWNELKYKASVRKHFGKIPLTKCYPNFLGQVFINILINAAHAISERGTITIKTWHDENSIFVSISDTGCGISKKHINKIFDPFFTTKDVGEGTGLGMSISYDIIEMHKGSIKVESEEGKWTKFTIMIPCIAN